MWLYLYTLLFHLNRIVSAENMESAIKEQLYLSITHYNHGSDLQDTPFRRKNASDRNPYIKISISFSIEYLSHWIQNFRIHQNTLMLTIYKKKREGENYDEAINKPVSILLDNSFQIEKKFVVSIIPNEENGTFPTNDSGSKSSKIVRKTIVTIKTTIIERLQNILERFKEIFDINEAENLDEFAFQFNFKLRKWSYKFDEEDSSPWTSTDLFSLKNDYDNILILSLVDIQNYHIGP